MRVQLRALCMYTKSHHAMSLQLFRPKTCTYVGQSEHMLYFRSSFTTSLVKEIRHMSAAALHNILGQGEEKTWKKLTEHEHFFLFAAVADQSQVVSLHELKWDRRRPRPWSSGAVGWVTCRQNSAAGEPLSRGGGFRVHVCRQWPCTAVHHPSKYGDVPPPARHGKIVRLCAEGESVPIEKAWRSLLKDIERGRADDMTPKHDMASAEDAPVPAALVDAMSEATSAVAEQAPTALQPSLRQDEVISVANVVGAPAEAEQGVTSALDAPLPTTLSQATSAVAERPSDAEAIRTMIMARADEISVAGAWVGLLEVMAFCAIHKKRVIVQMMEGTLDPIAVLAPRLVDATWQMEAFAGRLVVCRMLSGVWHTACFQTCTHYVASLPLTAALPAPGVGVVAQMARRGQATVMTESNGDCGIEALLVLAHSGRGALERTALRRRLQSFLQEAAASPVWHDAYIAAGELAPAREPQTRKADIRGRGAMTLAESTNPCTTRAHAAGAMVMADCASQALQAAILWAAGLKKPSDGFLRRVTESLTVAEGEKLVQEHSRGCGAIVKAKKPCMTRPEKARRAVPLSYKKAMAQAYINWAADRDIKVPEPGHPRLRSYGAMTRFLKESWDGPMPPQECHRQRMLLIRSLRQLGQSQLACGVQIPTARRVKRFGQRYRVVSLAGQPEKGGVVREELYDWFCLIKRSVRGRIPTAFVLQKASTMVEEYVTACLRQGVQAFAPVINYSWLREWRLAFGVSFRKPNRKWKVAGPILAERLRIAWENIYRVRQLAIKVLGYDLDLDNLDQSPFHMNEAGSKAEKSMDIRGGGVVPLKEGHAQTRERWTLQTTTTSNPDRARQVPPAEVMFRAGEKTERKLQSAVPSWAPWLTVVTGPKGSYREDDVLNFIENRLEPRTPGRRWRILLLDAYSAHLSDRVRVCAWHRGYVVITHGGGASCIAQTNDTDLHAFLKRLYMELEMADALEQMRLRPRGVPCPRKEDVIGWICCIWANTELHVRAARGFLKVGVSNALDGSQDAEICREAGEFWHKEGMRQRRSEVLHDVCVEVDAGRLRWTYDDVYSVVNPFPARGAKRDWEPCDKGSDSEADHEEDQENDSESSGDDADLDADLDAVTPGREESAQLAIDVTRGGGEAALEAARGRLQSMQVVMQQVQTIGNLSLEAQVQNAIHIEQRRVRALARADPKVTQHFFEDQEAEQREMRKDMASIRKAFAEDKERRSAIKDLLEQQDKLRQRKLELLRASTIVECENALKSWDLDDLGQGHGGGGTKAHQRTRATILERLRARSKPLPPDLANDWNWFVKHWDSARVNMLHAWQKDGWASDFLNIVKDLASKLRDDEDALAKWMRRERRMYLSAPALQL